MRIESTTHTSFSTLLRLQNLAASASLVALACGIYLLAPFNQRQLGALYELASISFRGEQFLLAAALGYVALLALFYGLEREPQVSKSLRCVGVLSAWVGKPSRAFFRSLSDADRLALLTTLLKSFFGPMMVMSLMAFSVGALQNGLALAGPGALDEGFGALFNRYGFAFIMKTMMFIDVLVFTVGYLVELPQLGNSIRSVDTSLMGWGAALLCYPPFNQFTAGLLGSQLTEFPQFDNPTLHLVLNGLLLALMAVYTGASVALGLKASNLTHRGIVARGPYALVRHPAYACKNMAWWIGSIPLVSLAFDHSLYDGLLALGSVVGWTLIYVMRALTEEDHLRRVDGDYALYAQRVRYRFLPGLL